MPTKPDENFAQRRTGMKFDGVDHDNVLREGVVPTKM
jgi:hypothetical protein